jgi:hypothetical protein
MGDRGLERWTPLWQVRDASDAFGGVTDVFLCWMGWGYKV